MNHDQRQRAIEGSLHDLDHMLRGYEARLMAHMHEAAVSFASQSDPAWTALLADRLDRSEGHSLYAAIRRRGRAAAVSSPIESIMQDSLHAFDLSRLMIQNLLGALEPDGNGDTPKTRVNLSRMVVEVVELVELVAEQRGIDLRLQARDEQKAALYANDLLLFRMLYNVIENAVKYSFETSANGSPRHIDIDVRRHTVTNDWLIEVKSYGVGILPEEIASGRLFEYGFRGQLARDRERSGGGIGLAEALKIVKLHKGRIIAKSTPVAIDGDSETSPYLTTMQIYLPGAH